MSCVEIRPLLPLRPLEVLEEDEVALVDAHLEQCPVCRSHAVAHDEVAATLSEPLADEPLPAGLWDKVAAGLDRPAPVAAPATPTSDLTITLSCSFCRDALVRSEAAFCASCLAPHHPDCFRAHGRCSAIGCDETRTVRPEEADRGMPAKAPPSRRSRIAFGVTLGMLVFGGVGTAALSFQYRQQAEDEVERANLAGAEGVVAPEPPRYRARVDVSVEGMELRDVVADLARRCGQNIVVDPNAQGTVSLTLRNVAWRDALDVIARVTESRIEEAPGGILILRQDPHVTLQFTDANVRTVLQLLAAYTGKNIVVSPDVTGTVTLDLKHVHWMRALETIVKATNLHARHEEDLVLVTAKPSDWGKPLASPASPPSVTVEPAPVASSSDVVASNRVMAMGAPVGAVLTALADAAGKKIVLPEGSQSARIDADVTGLGPDEAIDRVARAQGFRVVREKDDVIRVEVDPAARGAKSTDAPASTEVKLADGRPLVLRLEGVVFWKGGARSANRAVLNGRIYSEESFLEDEKHQRLPVRITAIRAGEVEVEVGDRGQRIALKVAR